MAVAVTAKILSSHTVYDRRLTFGIHSITAILHRAPYTVSNDPKTKHPIESEKIII
jgi:hypothetical protein